MTDGIMAKLVQFIRRGDVAAYTLWLRTLTDEELDRVTDLTLQLAGREREWLAGTMEA